MSIRDLNLHEYALPDEASAEIFSTIVQYELASLEKLGHIDDGIQPLVIVLAAQVQ